MTVKTCPRCGKTFVCMHDGDISRCQCAQVKLTKKAREHIASRFSDCLCVGCLKDINAAFAHEE